MPPRTDVRDYFHLAASLYALWRIPADVECCLLSLPATASTGHISSLALSFYPALLSRCLSLSLSTPDIRHFRAEKSRFASAKRPPSKISSPPPSSLKTVQRLCADELRCKQHFTAFTKVPLHTLLGYLETQSQSDTCTDGVGL